jgi:hypothetical protein
MIDFSWDRNNEYYRLLTFLITFFLTINGYAQINFSTKIEAYYLKNRNVNVVFIDASPPSWKGDYLNEENGIVINVINGVEYKDKVFAGVGLGYLNFEGIHGIDAFVELEYIPFTTRIRPLIGFGVGGSHIWNQYDKGTRTAYGELGIGLNINITDKIDIYTKTGYLGTQYERSFPFSIGVRI